MRRPFGPERAVRFGLAVAGAAILCAFLATRVFVHFDGVRSKLVTDSIEAVDGLVRIERIDPLRDPRVASLKAPVAVVATIQNSGATPEAVSITADGHAVCQAVIPARASKRLDCAAVRNWERRSEHSIDIRGVSSAWSLEYFELASHHGSSTRALSLLVLPDASRNYVPAGRWLTGFVWLAILSLWLVPVALRWPPMAVKIFRAVRGAALLFLAAIAVAPWFSPFLVLLSIGSFAKICAVLLAPQVSQVVMWLWHAADRVLRRYPRWRPQITAALVAAVVLLAYGLIIRSAALEFEGQYSGLLRVSKQFFDRVPFLQDRPEVRNSLKLMSHEGYDAQFQYFAIYDPLLRRYSAQPQMYRSVADAPPYRFGRMGFPMLARLVAGNRWHLYPVTMVALVWAGVGLASFALALLAQRMGGSAAWGLLVLAIPGFWQSVQVTLPEPVAAAFLLSGYLCVLSRRIVLATLLFAIALLVRETSVVLVLAIALLTPAGDLSIRSRVLLLCSALPIAGWRLYVAFVLWPDWGWQGLAYQPQVLTLPFAGLAGLWSDLASGRYHPEDPNVIRGAFWFSILLVGICLASWHVACSTGRVIGAALVIYAVMALSLTQLMVWSHVANAQRASFEVFVLLAVATVSFHRYSASVKATLATCWTSVVLYLMLASHDAIATRSALFPWT